MLLQHGFVFAIEFVAMAMALADFGLSVSPAREAVFGQQAGIRAQAHGAAELVDALQLAQLVNHAIRRGRIELGGIGRARARKRCGRTRSPWSACPGRFRNTEP